jgi:hypothetical protein
MAGILSINVSEEGGFVAVDADIDQLAVVMGVSSIGSGLSPFYLSGSAAKAGLGYSDAVDTLTQLIEQRQSSGGTVKKFPAAFYTTPVDTAAAYGTIDVTAVTGTSVVTMDAASLPLGTFEAYLVVVNAGTIAAPGITLRWSLDGGRTLSNIISLGTAVDYTIPNSAVKFEFAAGTLVAGDIVQCRTLDATPSTTELTAAFTALAASSVDFTLLFIDYPCAAADIPTITTGLNQLQAVGKNVTCIVRSAIPDWESAETESAWVTAVTADYVNTTDSRIHVRAAYCLVTDAMTSRQYLRSDLAQFAADTVRVERFVWPGVPADRAVPNASLVDGSGADVGHDEGVRGAVTGLSNETLGNRLGSQHRLPVQSLRENVYNTVPWVLYANDERIRNMMTRRLANAMERVAVDKAAAKLGGNVFYTSTSAGVGTLTAASRNAVHGDIYQVIRDEFASEIQNAEDGSNESGLVQIAAGVTVSGGNLVTIAARLAPKVGGFILSIDITLSIQE